MTRIAIITDSTCNIPPEMVKQYQIEVVPQHLIWGTEDLLDLKDISPGQFYERLVTDPVHPKTSQPPPPEFQEFYSAAKKKGVGQIFVATVSAGLSGTYASANKAAEESKTPAYVHDSRSVAMGLAGR
jgi:DegV family protein with EDD domain